MKKLTAAAICALLLAVAFSSSIKASGEYTGNGVIERH